MPSSLPFSLPPSSQEEEDLALAQALSASEAEYHQQQVGRRNWGPGGEGLKEQKLGVSSGDHWMSHPVSFHPSLPSPCARLRVAA